MDRLPDCIFFDVLSCTDPSVVVQLTRTCAVLNGRVSGLPSRRSEAAGSTSRGLLPSIKAIWSPLPQPPANYMDGQPHLNREMRAIAVDWLIDVVRRFDAPCTVYDRAVDLLDAHLSRRETRREELQNAACAAMGAALAQWGESSGGRAAGSRPPIRLEDLARAMLVLKTQDPAIEQMDALELLRLPGPYDHWTRFAVFMTARGYSLEQVRHMRELVEGSGWQWLGRLTASCHARRFADMVRMPQHGGAVALSLCGYMLLDLDFRRWSPDVRGAACAIVAVLVLDGGASARCDEGPSRYPSLSMLRRWRPKSSAADAALAIAEELAREADRHDGLPCCTAALVRFMERATGPGYALRAVAGKDPEAAERLQNVEWASLMVEVAAVFEGRI